MDQIRQYQKVTNVKPDYHVLRIPFDRPSKKRIIFNGKELELHYDREFGIYVEEIEEYKRLRPERKLRK